MDSGAGRGRRKRHVFKGSVLVSLLLEVHPRQFQTRADALHFARQLLHHTRIRSVFGSTQTFEDSAQLYMWQDDDVPPRHDGTATMTSTDATSRGQHRAEVRGQGSEVRLDEQLVERVRSKLLNRSEAYNVVTSYNNFFQELQQSPQENQTSGQGRHTDSQENRPQGHRGHALTGSSPGKRPSPGQQQQQQQQQQGRQQYQHGRLVGERPSSHHQHHHHHHQQQQQQQNYVASPGERQQRPHHHTPPHHLSPPPSQHPHSSSPPQPPGDPRRGGGQSDHTSGRGPRQPAPAPLLQETPPSRHQRWSQEEIARSLYGKGQDTPRAPPRQGKSRHRGRTAPATDLPPSARQSSQAPHISAAAPPISGQHAALQCREAKVKLHPLALAPPPSHCALPHPKSREEVQACESACSTDSSLDTQTYFRTRDRNCADPPHHCSGNKKSVQIHVTRVKDTSRGAAATPRSGRSGKPSGSSGSAGRERRGVTGSSQGGSQQRTHRPQGTVPPSSGGSVAAPKMSSTASNSSALYQHTFAVQGEKTSIDPTREANRDRGDHFPLEMTSSDYEMTSARALQAKFPCTSSHPQTVMMVTSEVGGDGGRGVVGDSASSDRTGSHPHPQPWGGQYHSSEALSDPHDRQAALYPYSESDRPTTLYPYAESERQATSVHPYSEGQSSVHPYSEGQSSVHPYSEGQGSSVQLYLDSDRQATAVYPYSDNEKQLMEEMRRMKREHRDILRTYEGRINKLMAKMHELRSIAEMLENSSASKALSGHLGLLHPPPAKAALVSCVVPGEQTDKRSVAATATEVDAPPPLPPRPGRGGRVYPNKPIVHTRAPMKPLTWTRVILGETGEENSRNTVWHGLQDVQVDTGDLERLYSVPDDPAADDVTLLDNISAVRGRPKHQLMAMFDGERSQRILTELKNLRCTLSDVINAVTSLDCGHLHQDSFAELLELLNSPRDVDKILHHVKRKGPGQLDTAEFLIFELSKLDHFRERLEFLRFKNKLQINLFEIDQQLRELNTACNELLNNVALKRVLQTVLSMGNYLNGGTERGQADGFGLDILNQLKDCVDRKRRGNLLELVMRAYCLQHEADLDLGCPTCFRLPEPSNMRHAAQVSFEEIQKALRDLREELSQVRDRLEVLAKRESSSVTIGLRVSSENFLTSAVEVLGEEKRFLEDTKTRFWKTTCYFTCSRQNSPREFFQIFATFLHDCKYYWKLAHRNLARDNFDRDFSTKCQLSCSSLPGFRQLKDSMMRSVCSLQTDHLMRSSKAQQLQHINNWIESLGTCDPDLHPPPTTEMTMLTYGNQPTNAKRGKRRGGEEGGGGGKVRGGGRSPSPKPMGATPPNVHKPQPLPHLTHTPPGSSPYSSTSYAPHGAPPLPPAPYHPSDSEGAYEPLNREAGAYDELAQNKEGGGYELLGRVGMTAEGPAPEEGVSRREGGAKKAMPFSLKSWLKRDQRHRSSNDDLPSPGGAAHSPPPAGQGQPGSSGVKVSNTPFNKLRHNVVHKLAGSGNAGSKRPTGGNTLPKSSDTFPKSPDTFPKASDMFPKSGDTFPKLPAPVVPPKPGQPGVIDSEPPPSHHILFPPPPPSFQPQDWEVGVRGQDWEVRGQDWEVRGQDRECRDYQNFYYQLQEFKQRVNPHPHHPHSAPSTLNGRELSAPHGYEAVSTRGSEVKVKHQSVDRVTSLSRDPSVPVHYGGSQDYQSVDGGQSPDSSSVDSPQKEGGVGGRNRKPIALSLGSNASISDMYGGGDDGGRAVPLPSDTETGTPGIQKSAGLAGTGENPLPAPPPTEASKGHQGLDSKVVKGQAVPVYTAKLIPNYENQTKMMEGGVRGQAQPLTSPPVTSPPVTSSAVTPSAVTPSAVTSSAVTSPPVMSSPSGGTHLPQSSDSSEMYRQELQRKSELYVNNYPAISPLSPPAKQSLTAQWQVALSQGSGSRLSPAASVLGQATATCQQTSGPAHTPQTSPTSHISPLTDSGGASQTDGGPVNVEFSCYDPLTPGTQQQHLSYGPVTAGSRHYEEFQTPARRSASAHSLLERGVGEGGRGHSHSSEPPGMASHSYLAGIGHPKNTTTTSPSAGKREEVSRGSGSAVTSGGEGMRGRRGDESEGGDTATEARVSGTNQPPSTEQQRGSGGNATVSALISRWEKQRGGGEDGGLGGPLMEEQDKPPPSMTSTPITRRKHAGGERRGGGGGGRGPTTTTPQSHSLSRLHPTSVPSDTVSRGRSGGGGHDRQMMTLSNPGHRSQSQPPRERSRSQPHRHLDLDSHAGFQPHPSHGSHRAELHRPHRSPHQPHTARTPTTTQQPHTHPTSHHPQPSSNNTYPPRSLHPSSSSSSRDPGTSGGGGGECGGGGSQGEGGGRREEVGGRPVPLPRQHLPPTTPTTTMAVVKPTVIQQTPLHQGQLSYRNI